MMRRMSIVLVLLDGLGLAPPLATNPLVRAPMPYVRELLGGALTLERVQAAPGLLLRPLDATFGVPGLPQSGTNHTALLCGQPAPRLVGRHQSAFPPTALRPLLREQSLFRRVQMQGQSVAFANAYSPGYWQALAQRRIRRAASTIAAEGARLPLRGLSELWAGRALYWDIDGGVLARRYPDAPPLLAPRQAGAVLAALGHGHALVYYECFLPDLAAHGRLDLPLHAALARIDALLAGTVAALRPADTLVVVSDHGNSEDTAAPSHTRNPVPLLVVGPAAPAFAATADLADVAGAILAALAP
jgi:2,3-bisphosphoglycerate-independent phosphoglycerate mutase